MSELRSVFVIRIEKVAHLRGTATFERVTTYHVHVATDSKRIKKVKHVLENWEYFMHGHL